MMEAILGYIRDHFGEIVTVVAFIAAVYFYAKSRISIGASYYIYTDRLIGPMGSLFEGLEIVYDGVSIHSFASSKVFLWNPGTEVIRRDDIAPTAPLAINLHAPERALDYKVVYCSSPHSKVGIEPQGAECLLVSFDFLNSGDGCVLEILHTGDIGSLSMSGHIIGGGDIRKIDPIPESEAQTMIFGLYIVAPLLVIAGTVILATWIDMTWGEPIAGWLFLTPLIALLVVLPLISRKLVVWWSGGAVFKKLCDGYARQQSGGQNLAAWRHVAAFWFAVLIVAVVGFMLGVFSG